jgi:hypothetical protein
MLHKCLGYGNEPLVRPLMAREVQVKGKEALQVALLGVQRGGGLPSDLCDEVDCCQGAQTVFGLLKMRCNIMS